MTTTSLNAKLKRIKFTFSPTRAGRIHYLTADDIRVVLARLPTETWERLRAVHFNDRGWGRRCPGRVARGLREIAICEFPASVSCTPFCSRKTGDSPTTFGAMRGRQWPRLAVRRFMLYEVFLFMLGFTQVVDPHAKTARRRFAQQSRARQFAIHWRRELWSRHFDHPDPAHNAPAAEELHGQGGDSM